MKNFSLKRSILALFIFTAAMISINAQTSENSENPVSLKESIARNTNVDAPKSSTKQTAYVRPTAKKRLQRLGNDGFGLSALIGTTIGSGIDTLNNDPPEWEKNIGGFGKRFASNYGENAIQETTTYAVNEAFKLDDHLYKSQKTGVRARLKDALISGFTTRTASGKRIVNFPRIIGTYTGSIISTETWFPNRYSYKDGIRRGSQTLGFRIGFAFINEFIIPGK
ncbi:MAG: hypothetical protein H7Z37_08980 [Pyrinomonadaceae bacterium]|nr:hypothetical protein [Pyrinomonadaceae bacterium]